MYSNAPTKQSYVIFKTTGRYGHHRTTVHGHASHLLSDVIRKPRASYRGEARPPARQGQLKIRASQNFLAYLTSYAKVVTLEKFLQSWNMWCLSLHIVVCGACLLESKIKKILTISLGKNIEIVSNNEKKTWILRTNFWNFLTQRGQSNLVYRNMIKLKHELIKGIDFDYT